MSYEITLPAFTGPLDLLLRLIERAELDITAIALASVADQYLAHVRMLDQVEPGELAEFVSVAARLVLIKSRALLPRSPVVPTAPVDEDAEQLAAQLELYRRFKQAAEILRVWQESGRSTFVRVTPPLLPLTPPPATYRVADLLQALARRAQLQLPLAAEEPIVLTPRLMVAEVVGRIRARLERATWFDFSDLLSAQPTAEEVIVSFWAVLELLKRQAIVVEQTTLFGPILIGRGTAPIETTDTDEREL
ncbi:segregation and condensation protein A [Chloroflexus sp.]